ncbi:MAG: hypothetical protein AAGK47_08905, partial [Bacteroidota bacterium]
GQEQLAMVVTPEGSRALRTEWKKGFYYTALKAGVPITCGYLDYEKKIAGVGPVVVYPTGNLKADLAPIMAFYKDIPPKFPHLFTIDEQYLDTTIDESNKDRLSQYHGQEGITG